jgi:hypothetical protein
MMRFCLLGLGALALGGCMTGSLVQVQGGCTSPSYLDTWVCIRSKVAANQAGQMNNDLGLHYLAVGDALAERVRARQIGDADAKLVLANELSSANAAYDARVGAVANTLSAASAQIYSAPPIAPPAAPITCTSRRLGNTVQTTC